MGESYSKPNTVSEERLCKELAGRSEWKTEVFLSKSWSCIRQRREGYIQAFFKIASKWKREFKQD